MSGAHWTALAAELSRWGDSGRRAEFWWRDDDAARSAPSVERLLALAAASGVPLALAVVPGDAEPALLGRLGPGVTVIQHGTDHRNRAGPGEKKTEFPAAEPPEAALERLRAARSALSALAGDAFVPVLAPPWNRWPRALAPRLAQAGYRGLSQFGARARACPAPGLSQVNAHVDLIDWRGHRGFAGEAATLAAALRHLEAKRTGAADPGEPTGWLTHHACHDDAAWAFLERLFEFTRRLPSVAWRRAEHLFPPASAAR